MLLTSQFLGHREQNGRKMLLTSRFLGHREQNGRKMLLTSQFLGHRERKKCSKREIILLRQWLA